MKQVRDTRDALRGLRRRRNMASHLIGAMEAYATGDGAHANQVRSLRRVAGFQLRVGDYRVLFTEIEAEIIVTAVGPRGDIYG